MRRLATGALLVLGLTGAAVFGVGASGSSGSSYTVRAIFDDAASAVPGEDVRIAGAKVGSIGSMGVTPQHKASIELKIADAGFSPFHSDATCTIRPQSLIGEKYVECEPGSPTKPELKKIPDGQDGAGQHLLPLAQTSSPVDLDLVNNVLRLPFRQRLSIILAELGSGFAGRGQDLNALIRRADPALRQTDRILEQLAAENQTLRRLALASDQALAPLARDRSHLSGFVRHATTVGEATAERSADIERGIAKLPETLRQTKLDLQDLGTLADAMTPVVTDLGHSAPSLNVFISQLGPFSRVATKSLTTLGQATDVGGPVLQRARPVVQDLKSFASTANPLSKQLDDLTASLDRTGGLEQAMNYIFFQMTAINGYDSIGHYLRAGLLVNTCSTYSTVQSPGCGATFHTTKSIQPGSASSTSTATSAAKVPSLGIGALAQRLLRLGTSRSHLSRVGRAGIARIRHAAQQDLSPALQNVGTRDTALLNYLMGNDR